MKNKGLIITLIALLSIVSILLIGLMVWLLGNQKRFNGFDFKYQKSNELIADKTYDTIFSEIKVDTDASSVTIYESSDQDIRVKVYGNKEKLNIDADNKILSLKLSSEDCRFLCFNLTINKIEIYLPKDFDQKILINNNYGDITIDEFLQANIEVNEDAGNVTIKGGNSIIVNNNYGNVEVGMANDVKIEANAGDVTINKVATLQIENDYGNIYISEITNYLDIKEDCGDVKIDDINLTKDSKIVNNLGDIKIGKTNDIFIDAKVDLGEIKINKNFRMSDITLKLENDCGDIIVNN